MAVEVSEEVREKISYLQKELQRTFQFLNRARWVKPENFHFTLKFLGEVSEEKLSNLIVALNESVKEVKSFEIKIQGLGAFPSLQKPRLLWVGVREGAEELRKIAEKVEKNTREAGFAPQDKAFSPHLTLVRFPSFLERERKQLLSDFSKKVDVYNSFVFGSSAVSQIVLMKSVLSAAGPHYSLLEEFPFRCN